ncbi:hypothetical protein FAM09_18210 [Niastella caeni]|uniref:Uncharacterized protein n=1 Tax=Niastella caeni TaxID=2569763 RepID=A0A4S8HNJ5_9BACT|nr:hypothetical protein [Niastella caeni]THU36897.1 hypothetical protein FAM09_18210 [Niastella caeni]
MRHIFAVSKSDTNMQGAKSMQKNKETVLRRRDVAALVADIHGVTADHVRKVIRGDRDNEEILATYMHIIESDNQLLKAVKNVTPFNSNPNPKT